jgi:lysophospholipase L1-like esterase
MSKLLHSTRHEAFTISQASQKVAALTVAPDAIAFQLGTNDIKQKSVQEVTTGYMDLLTTTQTKFPNSKIITLARNLCNSIENALNLPRIIKPSCGQWQRQEQSQHKQGYHGWGGYYWH